jgi:hypothetical protein
MAFSVPVAALLTGSLLFFLFSALAYLRMARSPSNALPFAQRRFVFMVGMVVLSLGLCILFLGEQPLGLTAILIGFSLSLMVSQ